MIKTDMNMKCDSFIAIMAFRYALGRCSAAPSHCAEWLTLNLKKLGSTTLRNIYEEIEDARENDERRPPSEDNRFGGMLGMSCDRSVWLRLRDVVQAERIARGDVSSTATSLESQAVISNPSPTEEKEGQ